MMNDKAEIPANHHFSPVSHHSPCQLIVDPPAEGAWNMAVDEALLEATAATEIPTLRFYQWLRPTLSLGYFQQYADREKHQPSRDADVVRRLSGGGAILHDQELTYSLLLPQSHPLARDTQRLYRVVHEAIQQLLTRMLSLEKTPWRLARCKQLASGEADAEPFLCFQRRSPGDVLLQPADRTAASADYKIVGSAQRRRRGVVLQHGSLLLGKSLSAPELFGLGELVETNLDAEKLLEYLPAELALHLGMELQQDSKGNWNLAAERLVESRYASSLWTKRR